MTSKTYDVYCGKRVELPRITAFLIEYDDLCERHGLRFNAELSTSWEACDTTVSVSIIPLSEMPPEDEDHFVEPELSESIPEVSAAVDRAKAEFEDEHKARENAAAARAANSAATDPIPGLEMAYRYIGAGNSSDWVPEAKAAIAEAINRLSD